MTNPGRFPDAEAVTADILDALPGDLTAVTETPPEFTPPLWQVQRSTGDDNGITDRPIVQVTCYGATRAQAWQMAETAREALHAAAHTIVNGVLVDSVRTVNPPAQLPDPRRDLRVVVSSYRLGFRRARTT